MTLAGSATAERTTRRGIVERAFTLVEMVIVIAVILVLVGLVLPAATTLWNQRRVSEAQNTITGLLATARMRAIQAEQGETGLLFFVDGRGVQRIVYITRDPNDPATPDNDRIRTWQTDPQWQNVFTVVSGRSYSLPPPMRAVPRYTVEDEEIGSERPTVYLFSEEELANEDFYDPPADADHVQRHRNFFTVVYASDGRLMLWDDVLIRDVDADEDSRGDFSAFEVSDAIEKYFRVDGTQVPLAINPGGERTDIDLVSDPADDASALNFPSVDGLLVYDDSIFRAAGSPAEKRAYLLNAAQPFYVHRITGAVIRGPIGENVASSP